MSGENLKTQALKLHKKGFKVFPIWAHEDGKCLCGNKDCGDAGKHPKESWKRWRLEEQKKEFVELNFDDKKVGGIGIPTGGSLFVLDTDIKDDFNGEETLDQAGLDLPSTFTVKTGSGGIHRYYKLPEGERVKSGSNLYPGVDVRGEGGYVVAPGSQHGNGNEYEIITNGEITQAPAELLKWLKESPLYTKKAQETPEQNILESPVPKGERNVWLQSEAVKMFARGYKRAEVRAHLYSLAQNPDIVEQPFGTDEQAKLEKAINGAENYIAFGNKPQEKPREFTLVTGDELKARDYSRDYIIGTNDAGILAPGFLIWMLAPPKTGKSLLALDMAMSISDPKPVDAVGWGGWLGFPVSGPKTVLFCSAEGGPHLLQERQTIRGQAPSNLIYWWPQEDERLDLGDNPGQLISMIEKTGAEVVILDPLVKFHCKDENSTKDMAELMKQLQNIRVKTGVAIVMVHHTRKRGRDAKAGSAMEARGSSVIWGEVDSTLVLEKDSKKENKILLDFELRNSQSPTTHHLHRNSNLHFVVEEVKDRPSGKEPLVTDDEYKEALKRNAGQWLGKAELADETDNKIKAESIKSNAINVLMKENPQIKHKKGKHSKDLWGWFE